VQAAVRRAAKAESERSLASDALSTALRDYDDARAGHQDAPAAPRGPGDQPPTVEELGELVLAVRSRLPGLPAESSAEAEHALRSAREDLAICRHGIAELEGALGLQAADLDAEVAREAERYMRELEVRQRAADLVGDAAVSVVRAVLPNTMAYLRRILPPLTGGRYFDARLTDDYQIEVWDHSASGWRRKNIFSGGAKDQFSLALRLAFALATLPEERGAWPGFLFLDEPLGSFDRERSAALIDVLTEGEVARGFDQLFLISHVEVPDRLFDYVISMSDGARGRDGPTGGESPRGRLNRAA
jgi:DNA repair exonuclease SbcCD ATPase subunit